MRIVIQRVGRASVTINGNETRSIGKGLMVLLGVGKNDGTEDAERLAGKLVNLRIFEDSAGKMNLSVTDIGGEIMVVSQFTLFASTRKGNRPGFSESAPPEKAIPLYEHFVKTVDSLIGNRTVTGEFGADMDIDMVNHGPVTILVDTEHPE